MSKSRIVVLVLAAGLIGSPSFAAQATQPPMDQFNNAFYNCDDNQAFLMSYDAKRPANVNMTTSPDSKKYMLKKAKSDTGVQFSDGTVTFWTDGATVTVEGTEVPLRNCKLKGG